MNKDKNKNKEQENLGTLKEKLCCEGVSSREENKYSPNQKA